MAQEQKRPLQSQLEVSLTEQGDPQLLRPELTHIGPGHFHVNAKSLALSPLRVTSRSTAPASWELQEEDAATLASSPHRNR